MAQNVWFVLLSLIPALINLGIIFYLIFFLPKSKPTQIFTFFVIALILWQSQDTILRLCDDEQTARFWYKSLSLGWMAVGSLAFHFACTYTGQKKLNSNIALICNYLPFLILETLFYADEHKFLFAYSSSWGWIGVPRPDTFDSIQRLWISFQVIAALFLLFRYTLRIKNDKERWLQSLFISLGMLIPTLQGIITQVVFPLIIHKQEIPVTSTFMTFFSLATIISLNKYKLFNISESIRGDKVLENLTNKVFVVSPEKKILYLNPHASIVFDIRNGGILFPFENIFASRKVYESFCRDVFDKTMNGHPLINYESTLKTSSNLKIDVLISSQLITNNNMIQGVLLVIHNISDKIKAVKDLELSNERYKYVTQASFDAIWDWNIKTKELYLGDAFSELFGYKLRNNSTSFSEWAENIHEEDRDRVILSRLNKIINRDETSWHDEYRYIRHDGSVSFVSDRGILLRKKNSTYRMIGAMQDITDRKQAEEKIMLERSIKQKEITEAVVAAQESERSEIGKELHDNINQLLGASRLYIETARTDPERRDFLLVTSSTYTLNAIEEIRKLSKRLVSPFTYEAGLTEVIENLIESITLVHPVKIKYETNRFEENRFNEKFKLNVFRIIQEQLNNTLKYAKAKCIEINLVETDTELSITISDDGVGFDTKHSRQGIGIFNINSRAELYKGKMLINSKPGHGCHMSVIFVKSELLLEPELAPILLAQSIAF